jgi:hypothetical protein
MAPAAPEDDIGGARGRGTLLVPAAGVLGNQRSPAVLGWGVGLYHGDFPGAVKEVSGDDSSHTLTAICMHMVRRQYRLRYDAMIHA